MSRKICVVTGTRAEYGLLRWVMRGIQDRPDLCLQLIVTGMHLSPEFGLTWRDIEKDGFKIDRKVEMLTSSDTSIGVAKSMGLGMIGFADALDQLAPDLIVVLGDRYEILSVVSAALVARIPVAHLHGGESTEGLIDESIRHSITKMSHLHFVAAEPYRKRVIQLGESPEFVFLVGGLGVDAIKHVDLLDRRDFERSIDFELKEKNLLVTFHPVTLESSTAREQMAALLAVLDNMDDTGLIFTYPNSDTDGRVIIDMIEQFVSQHENARAFVSLGQQRYFSAISHVDGVVGNSSSGLIEAPSFKKGTVDIGDRQRGRLRPESVINCAANEESIAAALNVLYSPEFQAKLQYVANPYGDGGASERIVNVLSSVDLKDVVKKRFFDIDKSCV
ncbi:GDP/UDP-N,N'-diacetylbacillosamine 2-epimerase (hydrolysing) [Formivibrio citricus]|uniref:GDP/UDP-N,N'-diacetylbacillosamine 2-epimerase (Hydrolysing) n=1 Tax=Formivibrio citricus TaxID=83765 RepID=A0A1I4XVN0_9NEIS|nr:UDP-N-acetylglucosamine 2-epimerase [Formivibrio citricus]SFN29736.1 GDP/UDP-N,N'-diacetylbacillosamine 2-epimerase (hydrolysing) [Formivibrio citricus]